uniref:Polyketide synthase type III n=1 Tax=Nephromopsis pallescens TaxID=150890 RepID=A0A2U9QI99_9LECA|nr:polyketide synthase type III [Nephromopsis pallescens]
MAAIEILPANDGIAPQPAYEPHDSYRVSMVGPSMDTKYDYAVTVKEDVTTAPVSVSPSKETPGLYITGLGSQYPPFLFTPEKLEGFIKRWYDLDTPGIKKLLTINQTTMIQSRSTIKAFEDPFWSRSVPPSISELDRFFRKAGVDLTVQACKKAMRESGSSPSDITHIVAVTCTNAGNPGFDLLVAQKLGLKAETDRTLLHGVGCAGGLSAMRAAAAMAQSASMRGRPAKVLVFACEICSINVRCDLEEVVEHPEETKISPVLFSDGAAAFVITNELAPGAKDKAVYSLINWETATMPGTAKELEFMTDPSGFRATLTKEVPHLALKAITPMFEKLLPFLPSDSPLATSGQPVDARSFDWALHPGGIAILNGAQQKMQLHEEQLRASFDVYKNHGNSSSPTVLIVLDQLRKMGEGRENIMACSFGPGMTIEMAMLKRCRHDVEE